jgi:hypothetical protein
MWLVVIDGNEQMMDAAYRCYEKRAAELMWSKELRYTCM